MEALHRYCGECTVDVINTVPMNDLATLKITLTVCAIFVLEGGNAKISTHHQVVPRCGGSTNP